MWLKRSGFWAPYSTPRGADGLVLDLIRSNAPKGYPYSYWIGYTNGTLLPLAWDMVFKGATGVWWFQLPGDGTLGWLGRNDVPYAQRQELIDQAILPLRRGLGDLLIRLDQQHDRIALYYSPQTALASGTEFLPEMKGPGLGREFARADNSAAGAVDLIRDSGREFLYLTKGRVLAGDLQKLGIKLLLLPMIQPLGEDEVAALRTFASAGGVIVADLRPGVLSGRTRPVASGPADALFGITRSGAGKAKMIEPSGTVKINGQALTLALGQVVADSELAAAGATAALTSGGVPLLLENKVGSGAVWLLNAGFDRYPGQRTTAIGESWRSIFAGLSARAGLPKPLATMATAAGGNPLARLQVWNRGGVSIYGVLDGEGKGSLTLAKAANLFDLRKGSLGKGDKAAIEPFAADTAHFIAAYDYDPGRPTVAVGKPEGAIVTCAIAMSGVPAGETGTFSYHTRLLDPQGTWVDVIPWSVQGAGGKAELRIRFALNDAAGNWSLAVREVTTGRETTVKISRP